MRGGDVNSRDSPTGLYEEDDIEPQIQELLDMASI